MNIRLMNLTDLKPADYNPRKALKPGDPEYEKLRRAIAEFGYVDPVVWNERTGRVVGGHQRLQVLMDLGATEAHVSVVDLSEEREKALNIALNKIGGAWDMDKLKDLLIELEASDIDVELTGFDLDEAADIVGSIADDIDPVEDGFDAEAEAAKIVTPETKPGDLCILGDHRLYCGDARKRDDMDRLMEGRRADLLWTDPPYNVDYHNEEGLGLKNDNMPLAKFREFLLASFRTIFEALREGACAYVCHSDVGGHLFRSTFIEAGFLLKQCLVWVKNQAVLGRQDYNWKHEPILYGWKPGRAHYFCMDYSQTTVIDEDVDVSKLKREDLVALAKELRKCQATTVIREDKPLKNPLHPTMKPISLVGRLVRNSTPRKQGVLVLDAFAGSGSTIVACEQLNRTCCSMELDPIYCDVIVKRWEAFTGRTAERCNSK